MAEGATEAVGVLAEHATGPGDSSRLLAAMARRPADQRWDLVARAFADNGLAGVVPDDVQHQQAARAELVNSMAHEGWVGVEGKSGPEGHTVGSLAVRAAYDAVARIRDHYVRFGDRDGGAPPYPAAEPGRDAPTLPVPAALDPAVRSALSGQVPLTPGQREATARPDSAAVDGAQERRQNPGPKREGNHTAR